MRLEFNRCIGRPRRREVPSLQVRGYTMGLTGKSPCRHDRSTSPPSLCPHRFQAQNESVDCRQALPNETPSPYVHGITKGRPRDANCQSIERAHHRRARPYGRLGLGGQGEALYEGDRCQQESRARRYARADTWDPRPPLRPSIELGKLLVDPCIARPSVTLGKCSHELALPGNGLTACSPLPQPRANTPRIVAFQGIQKKFGVERCKGNHLRQAVGACNDTRDRDQAREAREKHSQKGSLCTASSMRSKNGWRNSASVSFG
jgi:hypothetical protein